MTTSYYTLVSKDLLPALRSGDTLFPPCLRLKAELGDAGPNFPNMTWVSFEDDDAPPELEGKVVIPTIGVTENGQPFIYARHVDDNAAHLAWPPRTQGES